MSLEAASDDAGKSSGAFSRGTVVALLLAGLFSASVLAVLGSFAPDLRTGGDPRAHALSKSAVGFGGLVKLLQAQGEQVIISRSSSQPGNPGALRILTPDTSVRPSEIDRLSEGLTLLVLPKWELGPDLRSREWVRRVGLEPGPDMVKGPLLGRKDVGLNRRPGAQSVRLFDAQGAALGEVKIERLQTISGAVRPIIVDDTGAVVMGELISTPLHRNPILVLAEPDLLSTYGLRDLNGASVAMRVLQEARPGPGPVFFDVTLNGYARGRNLWKLAFTPPFLAATLCAVFAGLLMGLHAAVRFGPVRREERVFGMGKRALADNQAGLIRMAKREAGMAAPYLRLIRERTARIVGAGQITDEIDLERLLDRLGSRRTDLKITELSSEARQVADPAGLMRLARRLHQWKLEISRERQ